MRRRAFLAGLLSLPAMPLSATLGARVMTPAKPAVGRIVAGTIVESKIAAGAVTADKILAGAVTTTKIDIAGLTTAKMMPITPDGIKTYDEAETEIEI